MRRFLLLVLFVLGLTALAGFASGRAEAERLGCGAGTNGSQGYAYAGRQSTTVAHGIRATITPTAPATVAAGHVAGWIGVGGPGQGPNGETMWLQVGVASIPETPTMVYAEITRPGRDPQFVQLLSNVRVGESHKVAVLEIAGRANWWRVWLDGKPATDPILLENSTNRWRPIATGESWNGGETVCNRFAFRFDGVAVASSAGGAWHPFSPGYLFQDRGFGVTQLSPSGARSLAGGNPTPYAFEAASL